MKKKFNKGYKLAKEAFNRAYAPYSKYQVGACIKTNAGDLFTGCNVENMSFGGTICAERSAIVSAISQKGPLSFDWIVIVSDDSPPAVPCGLCLQTLVEFCEPDFQIVIATTKKIHEVLTLQDLMPRPFAGL